MRLKFLVAVVAAGWVCCGLGEVKLYVSPDAALGGCGAKREPFRSLEEARDAIREGRKSGVIPADKGVSVLLLPGVYNMTRGLELTEEDSGSAGAPVVYRAERRGTVRLQGGVTIPAGLFKPVKEAQVLERLDPVVRGRVLVCDLAQVEGVPSKFEQLRDAYRAIPAPPWLYIDGRMGTLARWPNAGVPESEWAGFKETIDSGLPKPDDPDPAMHKARAGAFVFDDARPTRWRIDEGVWLFGYWTHDWSDEVIRIAGYDRESRVIKLAAPHNYGINAGTWGAAERRFFAQNLLEELDVPGEWYIDRKAHKLYLYPEGDLKGDSVVLATLTEPMIRMKGVSHVAIRELRFEFAHSYDGLSIRDCEGVEVAGCVIANVAGSGISVSGKECVVRSCDLYNLGKAGVTVSGGDRKRLINGNNLVENCHIHHYGIFQRTYAPGIGVYGCGNVARHNKIHDAPHNAFLYGGNEHLLELNDISRVVMETGDSGAFYTGRDWTSQGNVLRHNFVYNLGGGDAKHINTMGVYLDDCDCGDTIEGNIFFRAGRAIMIGGGRDNPVRNNLVVDCPIALHIDSRGMTWKHWNNTNMPSWRLDEKALAMNYKEPPWSERYPNLARIMDDSPREPLYNPIINNLFVDTWRDVCNFDKNVVELLPKLEMDGNVVVNTFGDEGLARLKEGVHGFTEVNGSAEQPVELGFRDRVRGDFRVKPAVLKRVAPGFEPIPFEKIGLYRDKYRRRVGRSVL